MLKNLVTLLSRIVNLLIAAVNGFDQSARRFNTLVIRGFGSLIYFDCWAKNEDVSRIFRAVCALISSPPCIASCFLRSRAFRRLR
jgi:hypothetical protein